MNKKLICAQMLWVCMIFIHTPGLSQEKETSHPDYFQSVLDSAMTEKQLTGISMTVLAPDCGVSWTGVAGYDSREKNRELQASQPFRIASITKTYVAAAILRLREEGKLRLDDPISNYLPEEQLVLLKSDGYEVDRITIRHCLQHRSGIYDYAQGSNAFLEAALQDPKKRWTRTEQIRFAVEDGEPLGKPGEVFAYSDTGYIILGEIIERTSKTSLARAMRELLKYDALGLRSTWLESLEPTPLNVSKPVHRYFQDIDATYWDNSMDLYGGGGIAATSEDIAKFINALFNGGIFEDDASLETMLSQPGPVEKRMGSSDYRMGLWKRALLDSHAFSHSGFWGTVWVYIPEHNSTVVINYTDWKGPTSAMRQVAQYLVDSACPK